MPHKFLRIEIAGLCMEINIGNLKSFAYLESKFKDFLTESKPDFVVRVGENEQYTKLLDIRTIRKRERENLIVVVQDSPVIDPFRIYTAKAESCQTNKSSGKRELSGNRTEIGFIDLKNRIAEIGVPRKDEVFILYNFLRVILSYLLAPNHGILLHASGIVKDREAYLFVGQPDSGKSTIAQVSKELKVLSDDCVCVRKVNGSFYGFGTPWSPLSNNGSAVLRKIFFLRRGKKLEFKKMTMPKLMEGLFWHGRFANLNFNLTEGILNTISEIANSIPSYEMYFSLNDNIWKGIEK